MVFSSGMTSTLVYLIASEKATNSRAFKLWSRVWRSSRCRAWNFIPPTNLLWSTASAAAAYEDNRNATKLLSNPVFYKRSKQIEVSNTSLIMQRRNLKLSSYMCQPKKWQPIFSPGDFVIPKSPSIVRIMGTLNPISGRVWVKVNNLNSIRSSWTDANQPTNHLVENVFTVEPLIMKG